MPPKHRGLVDGDQKTFTYLYTYLLTGIVLLIAVFLFAAPANAQTLSNGVDENDSAIDEIVEEEDFGILEEVEAPGRFHFLKRFGRSVKELTTFDPIKKAEVRLRHANLELLEGKVATENGDVDAGTEAIKRYEAKLEKIKADKLEDGGSEAAAFLDTVFDHQIKQQKILDNIEKHVGENLPEEQQHKIFENIHRVQQDVAAHVGEVLHEAGGDEGDFTARIDRVLQNQRGGDFREIKNLEVLKRIGDHIPSDARDAVRQAEDNALRRFAGHAMTIPAEERAERFEQYTRHVEGDETLFLEIFDEMKTRLQGDSGLPPEILEKIETAKDIAVRRFQDKIESFEDDEFRARAQKRAMARFDQEEADLSHLRVVEEFRQRVKFEDQKLQKEIEAEHEASIERFKEAFPDAQNDAERFRELSAQMANNPDPTTFRLLQELEEKVKSDPAKREFLEKMEQETKRQFADRAREEGDEFFRHISTNNPRDVEIFKKLQADFEGNPEDFFGPSGPGFGPGDFGPPPGFDQFFDDAIDHQAGVITSHLEDINDPELFGDFERRFDDIPPEIIEEIKRRDRHFELRFEHKKDFVSQFEFDERNGGNFDQQWESERHRFDREFDEFEDRRFEDDRDREWKERFDREGQGEFGPDFDHDVDFNHPQDSFVPSGPEFDSGHPDQFHPGQFDPDFENHEFDNHPGGHEKFEDHKFGPNFKEEFDGDFKSEDEFGPDFFPGSKFDEKNEDFPLGSPGFDGHEDEHKFEQPKSNNQDFDDKKDDFSNLDDFGPVDSSLDQFHPEQVEPNFDPGPPQPVGQNNFEGPGSSFDKFQPESSDSKFDSDHSQPQSFGKDSGPPQVQSDQPKSPPGPEQESIKQEPPQSPGGFDPGSPGPGIPPSEGGPDSSPSNVLQSFISDVTGNFNFIRNFFVDTVSAASRLFLN